MSKNPFTLSNSLAYFPRFEDGILVELTNRFQYVLRWKSAPKMPTVTNYNIEHGIIAQSTEFLGELEFLAPQKLAITEVASKPTAMIFGENGVHCLLNTRQTSLDACALFLQRRLKHGCIVGVDERKALSRRLGAFEAGKRLLAQIERLIKGNIFIYSF